jgi:hypothetical protein
MKLLLLFSLFQQPDPVCFQKYSKNADTLAKAHLASTTLTGYQKRARARLDSLLQLKCTMTTPAPVPQPTPTPTPTPTPGAPELPRATPAFRDPYPGRLCSVTVPSGGDVSAALRTARGGQVVCLTTAANYGPVTLPTRAAGDTGSIVLRTTGALPAEGERMRPSLANNLAKIHVATNATCAIETASRATGYFIRGIEVRAALPVTLSYDFVCLKLPQDGTGFTAADVPARIVLSQMYIHGHASHEIQNCIKVNSAETAIVDSWISECHMRGVENHGIASTSSPGVMLVQNNHLEAQSIQILIGGATPRLTNQSPPVTGLRTSDVTIRRNYFYTPAAWKGVWYPRKNHLELKNASRVLAEANVFDGSWEEASHGGVAVVLKSINDEGTCTWCQVSDVTIRWNKAQNVAMGLMIAGQECYASTGCSVWPPFATRLRFQENVFDLVNAGAYTGFGRGMQLGAGATNLQFERNVIVGAVNLTMMLAKDKPVDTVLFRENVFAISDYPLHVDPGSGHISAGVLNLTWDRMTLVGASQPSTMPPSTIVATESVFTLAAQIRTIVQQATVGVVVPP